MSKQVDVLHLVNHCGYIRVIHILLLYFVISHSACHSSNIYLFAQGFRSEKGIITEHKSTSVAKTSIHLIYTNTQKSILHSFTVKKHKLSNYTLSKLCASFYCCLSLAQHTCIRLCPHGEISPGAGPDLSSGWHSQAQSMAFAEIDKSIIHFG